MLEIEYFAEQRPSSPAAMERLVRFFTFIILYTLHFLARMLGIQFKQVGSRSVFTLFLLFVR